MTEPTRIMLAETLGMLYYFKHSQVVRIFQNSNLDFQSAKSAFTTGVFKLNSIQAINAYFKLLLTKAEEIEAKGDLDFGSVLSLKKSSKVVVFSDDAHKLKAKMLIKCLAKWTFKVLADGGQEAMDSLALLVGLVDVTQKSYQFELTEAMKKTLTKLIQSQTHLKLYCIAKFLNLCVDGASLLP